ncbi:hypothetical protein GCM10007148_07730 [Parvularcula lutaonensis]|nr:hypothetical protein GCM10007148_07730 [Parvularcula lutaonensis]
MGTMEQIGARLDQGGAVMATAALQGAFLALIAAALLAFLYTVFSGQMRTIPAKIAAMPEQAARGLGLNVMQVTIKGGESLTTREVMTALRDDKAGSIIGRPLPLLSASELRDAIEALGPVKHAAVTKLLPNTIHISVIERSPKALYQNADGEFFVIDESGAIIRPADVTQHTELLTISGTDNPGEATAFMAMLRRHPVLFARTAGIQVVGGRRFDIRFRNGFVAKLPEDNVAAALARLDSLEAGTGSLAATLDYIDLRDPEWAYYKPKEK